MRRTRQSSDKRLLGRWRSDRERTMAQWVFPKRVAAAARRRFEDIFGKLVLRFTPSFVYAEMEGYVTRSRYAVLWSGPDSCVICCEEPEGPAAQHIFFDGDHYSVRVGQNVEYFRRVPRGTK